MMLSGAVYGQRDGSDGGPGSAFLDPFFRQARRVKARGLGCASFRDVRRTAKRFFAGIMRRESGSTFVVRVPAATEKLRWRRCERRDDGRRPQPRTAPAILVIETKPL